MGFGRGASWVADSGGFGLMIVDLLLGLIETVILWGLSPLPNHEIDFVDNLQLLVNNLGALNYFLPISETIAVVVGIMILFPVFFGVNFALWCIALIRGGSSRG